MTARTDILPVPSTKVVQITNIAPQATKDQMQTLFGFLGKIEGIRLYPTIRDVSVPVQSRICSVKFFDALCVSVAQHMTNTVFIDRALIVTQYASSTNEIPDEYRALEIAAQANVVPGLYGNISKLPPHVTNQIEGVQPYQVRTTHDPILKSNDLPPYPPLPINYDSIRIEEIRRTLLVSNIDPSINAQQLIDFFGTAGDVKYVRFFKRDNDSKYFALIECFEPSNIISVLKMNGHSLGGRPAQICHSTINIEKPQAKSNEAAQREIEEAMTRVKEAQNLISAAIDPVIGVSSRDKKRGRSRSRSRRRSRSRSRGSRQRSRSRSRSRKQTRSRSRKRTRSRDRKTRSRDRKRTRSRSRSRSRVTSRTKSRSRSRSKISYKPKSSRPKYDKQDKDRSKDFNPKLSSKDISKSNSSLDREKDSLPDIEEKLSRDKKRGRSRSRSRGRSRSRRRSRSRSRGSRQRSRSRSRSRKRTRSRSRKRTRSRDKKTRSRDRRRTRSRSRSRSRATSRTKCRSRSRSKRSYKPKSSRPKDDKQDKDRSKDLSPKLSSKRISKSNSSLDREKDSLPDIQEKLSKGASKSPDKRSPSIRKSRSISRRKSRSPSRKRTPVRKKSRSISRKKSRSPSHKNRRSPSRRKSRTPGRKKSRSLSRRKSRSVSRKPSRSASRKKSRSPRRRGASRSPITEKTIEVEEQKEEQDNPEEEE